jgi:uncharacterized repeat protein (TIGR02059 family)
LKKVLIIIFLVLNTIASATDYYISSSGNDKNNGLFSSKPWKTIAKVNASSFSPGDTIFFNKGDTWREQLTVPSSGKASAYIVFSSYGTGVAPKILGSTEVTTWTNDGGNVWYSNNEVSDPYALDYDANIYFKETYGAITWGRVKKEAKVNLAIEYDWVWITNHIYIYSPTDPNTRYSGVEVSQLLTNINLNNKNYIVIDGLEIAYSGSAGIDEGWPRINLSGLIVKNCTIHHIGIKASHGAYGLSLYHSNMLIQNNTIHDSGRRNISLNLYNGNVQVHDIIIEGNTLYHGFHTTGVDTETDGVGTLNNLIIRNNMIHDDASETLDGVESYGSDGIFIGGGTGLTNIYIYNNIIKNTTKYALEVNYVTSVYVYNNTFYGVNYNIPNSGLGFISIQHSATGTIKNNIFYNNVNHATNGDYCNLIKTSGTVTSDYNLFYTTDAAQRSVYWDGSHEYTTAQWAIYKSEQGQDTHSPTPSNPLFISSSDCHLLTGSPAIDAGIGIGLTTDYDGNMYNDPPSMGAYEYYSSVLPVYQNSVVENATPSILVMAYSITLSNIVPAASSFLVIVNSAARTVNTVAISGNKVKLTLASPIVYGDTITISYTKPYNNSLQTGYGGVVASISNQPVVNNCINGTTTVNQLPVVEILNPLKGNEYETNSSITLEAMASDPDGSISKVEFYSDAVKLVELTSAPYIFTWKDVTSGSYSITAVAMDNLNDTTVSSPVEFVVGTTIKYDANSEIINLYPNPNDGHFSIEFVNPLQNERSEIIIADLAGKQVFQGTLLKEETIKQIDLSYIKSGIYLLMIIGKGIIVTKKIIKY